MKLRGSRKLGRCALAAALAFCMSVMMVPSVAFAETLNNESKTYDEDLNEKLIVQVRGGGTYTVTARDVTYSGDGTALTVDAVGARAVVTAGDVETTCNRDENSNGVYIFTDTSSISGIDGVAEVSVDSASASAGESGYGAELLALGNGKATLIVGEGGVTGKDRGLWLVGSANHDNTGTFRVLVDGTVRSTGGDGVYMDHVAEADGLSLVVWKIESGGGQLINVAGAGTATLDKYARAVGYIARVSDLGGTSDGPNPTGNLRATYADGTALGTDDIKGTFRVAHEGETIYLAVDDGYEIVSADNGGTALQKDASGRYFYTVQRGGGINLKAVVKAVEYEMSFDLGGGTVDGKTTYIVPATYGSTITLPAPVREGFEFQYWEGSRYYAGDLYKVEGPHSFKAIWKEKESVPESVLEPVAETKATPTATASSMPATGDSSPVVPAFVTLLVSLCALIVSRTKLNQRYVGKHTR